MEALRAALDAMVARRGGAARTPVTRLFVDRVFTIAGAGTVVTGTLDRRVSGDRRRGRARTAPAPRPDPLAADAQA